MLSESEVKRAYEIALVELDQAEEEMVLAKRTGTEEEILNAIIEYRLAKERLWVLRRVLYGN